MKNNEQNKILVIVDPYLIKPFFNALKQNKFRFIAVYSKFKPDEYLLKRRLDDNEFERVFYESHGYDHIIAELKKLKIAGVIIGFDCAIQLAIKIGHDLKLKYKIPIRSARFLGDKYLTGEYLKRYDLFPLQQIKVTKYNKQAAIKYASKNIALPLIVKPTNSSGSFGITTCTTVNEVIHSINHLLGIKDFFGNTLNELVIQEKLIGKEYVVCTVSNYKQHAIVIVLAYCQEESQTIPSSIEVVNPDSPEFNLVVNYAKNVLDATKIYSGQTATEIMLTQQGPCLIELNPRVAGLNVQELIKFTTGTCQGEVTALSYNNKKKFFDIVKKPPPIVAYGKIIALRNNRLNNVFTQDVVTKINSLASCVQSIFKYKDGDILPLTTEVLTIPAFILLGNLDKSQFESDFQEVLQIEKQYFL